MLVDPSRQNLSSLLGGGGSFAEGQKTRRNEDGEIKEASMLGRTPAVRCLRHMEYGRYAAANYVRLIHTNLVTWSITRLLTKSSVAFACCCRFTTAADGRQ